MWNGQLLTGLFRLVCRRCQCHCVNTNAGKRMADLSCYRFYSGLVEYKPPTWAANLKGIPQHKVMLGNLETPIHRWNLPDMPEGFEVFIKRDDMTGSTLSGNKVRKLEFLLADALKKGCKHIITCGSIQSNHCRATALAATQLGLKSHLILRADVTNENDVGTKGNLFLNRLCGADMYFVPKFSPYSSHMKPRMEQLAQKIKTDTGEESYLICVGGSDTIGLHGYLSAFEELEAQNVTKNFTDIVTGCGSGGTTEGLALGNYLSESNLKIHAITVCDDTTYFVDHINNTLQEIGITHIGSEDIVDIVDGYKGKGYGISQSEELDFIEKVARVSGVLLDPVYTGKAARGLVQELQSNPQRFQGSRILFIHTGGIFGMYDGTLESRTESGNNVHFWPEIDKPPF